jgi:hypothetical protein
MLTGDDVPTIRHAILKRLDAEPGVQVADIPVELAADCIRVGVLAMLGETLVVRSRFDLPPEFEIGHLHNEIDEIAEQYKAARADFWKQARMIAGERAVKGTGLRGRWGK